MSASGQLCDLCAKLYIRDKAESLRVKRKISLDALREDVSEHGCSFCCALLTDLFAERPRVRQATYDVACVFELEIYDDGLTQLTLAIRCDWTTCWDFCNLNNLVPDPEDTPNWTVKNVYDVRWTVFGRKGSYLDRVSHWMIDYIHPQHRSGRRNRVFKRPNWQSGVMDITRRFDVIDTWLDGCNFHKNGSHKACFDVQTEGYPSRLIDVRGFDIFGTVRLVETKTWDEPLPEYTTLSHCWGAPNGPRPLMTKSANYASRKRGIAVSELPKTFRHAVMITRRLGKQYIWIDSLTIIQDDQKDWEVEAAKMAAIYENSFLTIAATSSFNCQGGCDLDPWQLDIVEAEYEEYHLKLKRIRTSWKDSPPHLPLHTRGWCLQEAYLSRRVLHMTTHHMLWHCRKTFDQEDANVRKAIQGSTKDDLFDFGFLWEPWAEFEPHSIKYNDFWWLIVERYSGLNFTRLSDRIPAIAGVIQFYTKKCFDVPLLGLWRRTLARDLGWRCQHEQATRVPAIPTWTWLSSRSKIHRPIDVIPDESNELYADACIIGWERQPYVSKLIEGTLEVTTKMLKTTVRACSDPEVSSIQDSFQVYFFSRFKDDGLDMPEYNFEYHSDIVMSAETPEDFSVSYMLLYTKKDQRRECQHIVFLALRPSPVWSTAYNRIGYGQVRLDTYWDEEQIMDYVLQDWDDTVVQLC